MRIEIESPWPYACHEIISPVLPSSPPMYVLQNQQKKKHDQQIAWLVRKGKNRDIEEQKIVNIPDRSNEGWRGAPGLYNLRARTRNIPNPKHQPDQISVGSISIRHQSTDRPQFHASSLPEHNRVSLSELGEATWQPERKRSRPRRFLFLNGSPWCSIFVLPGRGLSMILKKAQKMIIVSSLV
jgi:hypothetical protein